MQEMRALVLERSTMLTYLRGEMIEILPYDVAILLEGFVKQERRDEHIAAPAALVPSRTEHHLNSSGSRQPSAAHQGTLFEADTRSRIIIFYLSSINSERHLRRASASLLSQSLLIPRHSSYEHEGLVSWPDKQYTAGEPAGNEVMKHERGLSKRLSARSIQLSVFGSMVNRETYNPRRSFLREPWGAEYRIRSNPSARPHIKKYFSLSALPSAQSERGASVRRKLKSQGSIASGRFSIRPQPPTAGMRRPTTGDDSSEVSDAEDEHIVRIDSASNLFRHQFLH